MIVYILVGGEARVINLPFSKTSKFHRLKTYKYRYVASIVHLYGLVPGHTVAPHINKLNHS
jgi:hypothetical protein